MSITAHFEERKISFCNFFEKFRAGSENQENITDKFAKIY